MIIQVVMLWPLYTVIYCYLPCSEPLSPFILCYLALLRCLTVSNGVVVPGIHHRDYM